MLDVRETLELHERGYLDRGGIADLRQVVARQVDEHHVLGELLGIFQQLRSQAVVLSRVGAAGTRARDRVRPHATALRLDERLRGGTHDLEVTTALVGQIQVVHVGRGVDRAQDAVHVHAAGLGRHVEALRQDNLECVPVRDRALGGVDGRLEVGAARALADGRGFLAAHPQHRRGDGRGQLARHGVEPLDRAVVGAIDALIGAVQVPRDGHQVHRSRRMIDRGDLRGKHERRVGDVGVLGRSRSQGRLPFGNDAPSQRSDEGTRQRGQALNGRGRQLLERGVHDLQERSLRNGALRVCTHPLRVAVAGHDGARARRSHEGPAPPGTPVLGGFENEAAVVAVGKLTVDANGAELVSKDAAHDGNHAPRRGKRGENVTRRPGLTPFEADRLGEMRRRRNTHRVIVPSQAVLGPTGPR